MPRHSHDRSFADYLRGARRRRDSDASILSYALELWDAEFWVWLEYRQNKRFQASYTLSISQQFKPWLQDQGEFIPGSATGLGRIDARGEVIKVIDAKSEDVYRMDDPLGHVTAISGGARSFAAKPMLAVDRLVGVFTIAGKRSDHFPVTPLGLLRCLPHKV